MKSTNKHVFLTQECPISNEMRVSAQKGHDQALYKQIISKV